MDWVEKLSQDGIEKWFSEKYGKERWTTIYQSIGLLESGMHLWVGMVDPEIPTDVILGDLNWGLRTRFTPGLVRSTNEASDEETVVYQRNASETGCEPLVLLRHFPNHFKPYAEINEELRLLFNLYESPHRKTLSIIEESGDATEVIRVREQSVEIETKLMRRYSAAKQMRLVLYIQSDLWIQAPEDYDLALLPPERNLRSSSINSEFWSGEGDDDMLFSRYLAAKVIEPDPISYSKLWPFEPARQYETFKIAIAPDEATVDVTCDPCKLPSYHGRVDREPFYFSQVFFSPQVLDRFYQDEDRYTVGDGFVEHKGAWQLSIDNHSVNAIMVFLGDLGRDLPYSEQMKWKPFNIAPQDLSISPTAFRRSFLAEFADSPIPEHRFKVVYGNLNSAWKAKYGWELFEQLHIDDEYVIKLLRTPINNSRSEFDKQVLSLAKLLADAINVKDLKAKAQVNLEGQQGSLSLLDRHLELEGFPEREALIKVLRRVQSLRSKSAAHLKSSKLDLEKLGVDGSNLRESFASLLDECTDMLSKLVSFLNSSPRT